MSRWLIIVTVTGADGVIKWHIGVIGHVLTGTRSWLLVLNVKCASFDI